MVRRPAWWLSLGLNLALGALAFALWRQANEPRPEVDTRILRITNRVGTVTGPMAIRPAPAEPFQWRQIESEDFREYIRNLRRIGCPEETIRDLIIAEVDKLFAGKIRELEGATRDEDFEYWIYHRERGTGPEGRRLAMERLRLRQEQKNLVWDLLGIELDLERQKYTGLRDDHLPNLGFLPPERQTEVRRRLDALKFQEWMARYPGTDDPGEGREARLDTIQQEREASLAALLTPEELFEFQVRNSSTAGKLREDLMAFEPTEEEFRTLFKLRWAFEKENGGDVYQPNHPLALERLQKPMEEALGPERWAAYQLSQDGRFRSLIQLTKKLGLPRESATTVYDIRRSAEEQKVRLLQQTTLEEAQLQPFLDLLASESEQAVREALGETGWADYRGLGQVWLDGLKANAPNP